MALAGKRVLKNNEEATAAVFFFFFFCVSQTYLDLFLSAGSAGRWTWILQSCGTLGVVEFLLQKTENP